MCVIHTSVCTGSPAKLVRSLFDNSMCSSVAHPFRVVRQTAQFLTLIWMAGTPQYFNPDAIHGFLSALCNSMDSDSQARRMLGDAAVGLLSVVEKRRDDPIFQPVDRCYEDQSIWEHTNVADPADLLLACEFFLPCTIPPQSLTLKAASLAAYVCATAGSRSSHLLWAGAWSYFCDVLLLILDKEFAELGSEEPLDLFVSPGICRALLKLVEIATDHACTSSFIQFEEDETEPRTKFAIILPPPGHDA